jgi:hypothetical protein
VAEWTFRGMLGGARGAAHRQCALRGLRGEQDSGPVVRRAVPATPWRSRQMARWRWETGAAPPIPCSGTLRGRLTVWRLGRARLTRACSRPAFRPRWPAVHGVAHSRRYPAFRSPLCGGRLKRDVGQKKNETRSRCSPKQMGVIDEENPDSQH